MKNKLYFSLFALLLFALCFSCGQVNEDERLIEIESAQVNRAVLIEDFTGQMCVNCPAATEEIHHLQQEFGEENVIAVGIYSGPFGVHPTTGRNLPLTTETGKTYFTHWNLSEQPIGLVNRHGKSNYPEWAAKIYDELAATTPVSLRCNSFESVADSLVMQVSVHASQALSAKLQLWIIEDSIVSTQYLPNDVIDRNYVHNHVFRAAVNGDWGTALTLSEGKTQSLRYSCLKDEAWQADNLSLVAFVYNDSGVLQVIKQHLNTSIEQ